MVGFCLVIRFCLQADLSGIVILAPGRFQIEFQDYGSEHNKPDSNKNKTDKNMNQIHLPVVGSQRNIVLGGPVNQATAKAAHHP